MRLDFWACVSIFAWILLVFLLLLPVGSVLLGGFSDAQGEFSLANFERLLSEPRFRRAFVNTLTVGFGGMGGALVLGTIMAFCLSRFEIRGARFVSVLAVLALISPPFIGAYSWIALFGGAGFLRRTLLDLGVTLPPLYGLTGILTVFALKFYPYVYLLAVGALSNVDRSLEEAAESLGLTPWRRLWRISFPLILPALSAGGLLAFVHAVADFGTPQLLGRGYNVLATEAYALYAAEVGSNLSMAATVSLALILLSMIVVLLQRRLARREVYHGALLAKPAKIRLRGWRSLLAHGAVYVIGLCGALPAIVTAVFSLRKTSGPVFQPGFGLQSYARILRGFGDAIWNSLIFSLAAAALIFIAGILIGARIARRPGPGAALLEGALTIPTVMPGIAVGVAYASSFNGGPLPLTGTALILVLALFIRRLPYAARSVSTALRQVSPNLEEAAVSLGQSPARSFLRVSFPLILPGAIAGAMLGFVAAINELSASLTLHVGRTATMPVRIYQLILDGDFGAAAALSSLLLLISGVAALIAFRLMGRDDKALL